MNFLRGSLKNALLNRCFSTIYKESVNRIMKDEPIPRRRFLSRSLRCTAAVAATGGIGWLASGSRPVRPPRIQHTRNPRPEGKPVPEPGSGSHPHLTMVRRGDAGQGPVDGGDLVRRAVEELGGIPRFVSRGDRVVVKPNIGWNRAPEQAANTDPSVVAAMVGLCLDAGAKDVLVTDHTCNDPVMCFERSGIRAAAEAAGARVAIPGSGDWVKVDLRGEVIGTWDVLRGVLEADRVISLPVAKQHGLAGYTGAMKNMYGVVGGSRGRLHNKLDASIVDMTLWARPVLSVIDGVRVLMRNGPSGGRLEDVRRRDTVIASVDPVAADALGCTLIDRTTDDVPHIILASTRELGILSPEAELIREVVL